MGWISRCLLVSLVALAVFPSVARATAFGTNYSDLWWNPAESGWGIQFVQQHDVIFATMFVHGQNGQPIWYSATMQATASGMSGDLYSTNGPYFGQSTFNAAFVVSRKVGLMSVAGVSPNQMTLGYWVDGAVFSKTIQRQVLVSESLDGTFVGAMNLAAGSKACSNFPTGTAPATVSLTHSRSPTISFAVMLGTDVCTVTAGTYAQNGHLGKAEGKYVCQQGDSGNMDLDQVEVSQNAISGSFAALSSVSGCSVEGSFAGVRQ